MFKLSFRQIITVAMTFFSCTSAFALTGVLDDVHAVVEQNTELADEISQQISDEVVLQVSAEQLVGMTVEGLNELLGEQQLDSFVHEALDENGQAVVAFEWMILLTDDEYQKFTQLKLDGVQNIDVKRLPELNLHIVKMRVNPQFDSAEQIKKTLNLSEQTIIERNHIYQPQAADSGQARHFKHQTACSDPLKFGLIDSQVNHKLAAFKQANIISKSFLPPAQTAAFEHGTQVASLLVGKDEQINPLLPNAKLFSAGVFYQRPNGQQGATAVSLAESIDWLLAERVAVINLSLTGPHNQILQLAVQAADKKGAVLVAAVGNQGAAAAELYPAAYQSVIAVTAVNWQDQGYLFASQGKHLDFSAFGVSVNVLQANGEPISASGTSFAAPVVAAHFACLRATGLASAKVLNKLSRQAKDLGQPGKDKQFGYGRIGESLKAHR
ncbi:S8 family serine peptidase [Gayadomonas joobiniege]|uniref:S8 family serine peptidase n=1 Tax=Gayadomonas joobiniege TaxID=1234606 RepID=UPI000378A287|nr:S8 family serine peptidase [Gayadomonas joobiniege]